MVITSVSTKQEALLELTVPWDHSNEEANEHKGAKCTDLVSRVLEQWLDEPALSQLK